MHDAALGRALAESEKDRAENVMIVDLLRNDLSRVCRPGTVRVPELFALEHTPPCIIWSPPWWASSSPDADAVDCIRAAFPGGSITGHPRCGRWRSSRSWSRPGAGVYCGSIGYVERHRRHGHQHRHPHVSGSRGQVYFQAGGGIVADSDPELEYRETLDKARG